MRGEKKQSTFISKKSSISVKIFLNKNAPFPLARSVSIYFR